MRCYQTFTRWLSAPYFDLEWSAMAQIGYVCYQGYQLAIDNAEVMPANPDAAVMLIMHQLKTVFYKVHKVQGHGL